MSRQSLMEQLGLCGLIHIWGEAATGKTMLASKIAADESKISKVEWINTDAKQSFVTLLKRDIKECDGNIQNVTVSMVGSRDEMRDLILNLAGTIDPDVSLVVIDSMTRLLDMARDDPTMWGRELIEEALPSLAGLVNQQGLSVIVTSEARFVENMGTVAVHHKSITKWADYDVHLVKHRSGESTRIILSSENGDQIGQLELNRNSLVVRSNHVRKTGIVEA